MFSRVEICSVFIVQVETKQSRVSPHSTTRILHTVCFSISVMMRYVFPVSLHPCISVQCACTRLILYIILAMLQFYTCIFSLSAQPRLFQCHKLCISQFARRTFAALRVRNVPAGRGRCRPVTLLSCSVLVLTSAARWQLFISG